MRATRLDDASCAICMEQLFNARDDLDEILPVATSDCGHVFHEKCLLDWFRIQANQFVAQARDQGQDQVTANDAPAECPECRAECYADPETGEPIIHRLFINFGDGGSSQRPNMASSPDVRASQTVNKKGDSDLLAFARRARGLAAEVEGLDPESREDEVNGTIRRVGGLRDDSVSSKAAEGFKNYVEGLTKSLDGLIDRLETHPLIPTLRAQISDLQKSVKDALNEASRLEKVVLPRQVKHAVAAEQAKTDKKIKQACQERDVIQRQLQKETVARTTAKRAAQEREAEYERQIGHLKRAVEKEQESCASLRGMLDERSRQLKKWQSRAESRKDLRATVEELKSENELLRRRNQHHPQPADLAEGDVLGGASGLTRRGPSSPHWSATRSEDDTLDVDYPDFDLSFDMGIEGLGPRAGQGRSTTSRSYVFNSQGQVKDSDTSKKHRHTKKSPVEKKDKGKGKAKASKYFARDTPASSSNSVRQDAALPETGSKGDSTDLHSARSITPATHESPRVLIPESSPSNRAFSPKKRVRPDLLDTSKETDRKSRRLSSARSSPSESPSPSPLSHPAKERATPRPNPFAPGEGEKQIIDVSAYNHGLQRHEPEIINLVDSSSPTRSPMRPSRKANALPRVNQRVPSVNDVLGMGSNGRLRKGSALGTGPKVRMRAR